MSLITGCAIGSDVHSIRMYCSWHENTLRVMSSSSRRICLGSEQATRCVRPMLPMKVLARNWGIVSYWPQCLQSPNFWNCWSTSIATSTQQWFCIERPRFTRGRCFAVPFSQPCIDVRFHITHASSYHHIYTCYVSADLAWGINVNIFDIIWPSFGAVLWLSSYLLDQVGSKIR